MPDYIPETLDSLNTILQQYLSSSLKPEVEINSYVSPADLSALVDIDPPEHGQGEERLAQLAQTYLDHSVRTGSWRYMNQLWSGFSLPGLVGEITAAASNTSMFTYEVAPLATLIEKSMIKRLCSLAGFDDGGGLFVTGGSNANLVALMAARFRMDPESLQQGIDGRQLRLFVSDQAHYSFSKAAHIMGFGRDHVITVKSDELGRMKPDDLQRMITEQRALGALPFCVAATAGTTVLGAYDPLDAIADVCDAENLWFHVDGAWGGSALMSDRLRDLMAGCERADSLTWDQHKMMGLPLICSTILFRDRTALMKMNGVGGEDYIFHGSDDGDLGPMSLQCGRRVDALKLWMAWQVYGRQGFAKRIERLFDLAQYMGRKASEHPEFELVSPVSSLNICFRYIPDPNLSIEAIDEAMRRARTNLTQSGRLLVNFAQVQKRPCWRVVLSNFDLDETLVDRAFNEIEAACKQAHSDLP